MSISTLVARYHSDRQSFLKSTYNETQLRADFLDPLFELLGWDIKNDKAKPTNEREVLLEEPLKSEATANVKKPDYTFRLFGERKYFLEAKKPSVAVESDLDAVKQVRRYGFTAKLKISVLCNFEFLAIYDCSKPVTKNDNAQHSRVALYHYTEYVDKFEEIKARLGRDEVYNGSFDVHWKHIENRLRRSSVDEMFLDQINQWRLLIGAKIYENNHLVTDDELNDLVQRYINSLIFLRVCEDRNLEVYKNLQKCAITDDFSTLISIFRDADKKYNAGLFDHDMVEEIITTNRSAFWSIINQLYYPESTYSFSVFSSDILGNIYEIFLGQQLKIIAEKIVLVKKPEHVDRDIVTTPTIIIQDILRETVFDFCKGKTDQQILSSSFADIACGSGAFLLELFQLLHDILVDYYLANDPSRLHQISASAFKLPYEIKRKIVKNCIFGIDKDFNAVQACKFGLLLKLLENENQNSISLPALPNIDDNISFGNSLVNSAMTSDEDINPFDFENKKFDVIVGNPPYMAPEHMKEFTPKELPLYKTHYKTAYKQFDKYFLFIERGIALLADTGRLGLIVPSKFTKVGAAKNLRALLKKDGAVKKIVSFGANQVFEDKTTYTCLIILTKTPNKALSYLEVQDFKNWKIRNFIDADFDSVFYDQLHDDGWPLVPAKLKSSYEKIKDISVPLEQLVGSENIFNGIQTSANDIYIHKPINEDKDYLYFIKDKIEWKIEKELTRPYFKTGKNTESLYTYRPFSPNAFVIYPYIKAKNGLQFVTIDRLENKYPCAFAYLTKYREKLDNPKRDIKPEPETPDEWYRYGRHQSLENCDVNAKVIVGVLSNGDKYAIDFHSTLISSGGTAGYCMITLPDNTNYSIYYIQALLNSKYLEWFCALTGEVFRGGYIARGTKILKKLPIRVIDFEDDKEKALHNLIAKLQKSLIEQQDAIDANKGNKRKLIPLRRRFEKMKSELDANLKQLYDLGDKDSLIPMISQIYAPN